jgi:hypothetical protein
MLGDPENEFEREAEHWSEHVLNAPVPHPEPESSRSTVENRLMRKTSGSGQATSGAIPQAVRQVMQSPGRPLEAATRAFMEPRFDHDFSQVRIHTGALAAESARSVNALAYTIGNDVVFGEGKYAPAVESGRKLLAHELAHVVQQGGNNLAIQRMLACPRTLSGPTPPGFKPYYGNPWWFHCGYRAILEDRMPSPNDRQNECVYDFSGMLVDEHHPFSGCRGTPDQYDSQKNTLKHIFIDSGGIVRAGIPAFFESRLHDLSTVFGELDFEIRKLYGAPF